MNEQKQQEFLEASAELAALKALRLEEGEDASKCKECRMLAELCYYLKQEACK